MAFPNKLKGSIDRNSSKENPFVAEKLRQVLATQKDFVKLKKTYNKAFKEIFDINSRKFWNKKLSNACFLNRQDEMTKDRINEIFKLIPKETGKILDIGMGMGYIEELLNDREKTLLFGNDISKKSIENANKNFRGEFKLESWKNMIFSRSSFDVILLLEVLEHIPPSNTFLLLGKIRKYLKKDGFFILSVPINEGLENMNHNPNGHLRIYTEDLIKAELQIAGFKTILIKRFYAFEKYYRFKKLLLSLFRNRWNPNVLVIMAKKI
ncbi:class I SAM-dependent methyltransferase [Patescibacteria group bacterium]|nr:class I SAM-dependent methyltransferase [Patescibacteria group bacterium]